MSHLTDREQQLEEELYKVRRIVLSLLPDDLHRELTTYLRCESREQTHRWESDVVSRLIGRAVIIPEDGSYSWQERAYCPLCGSGGSAPYTTGFIVPEGLRRHLTGWSTRCSVMEVTMALAREHWHSQFAEQEAHEASERAASIATRKRTEHLYDFGSSYGPRFINERIRDHTKVRDAESLEWARQRLLSLGFAEKREGQIISFAISVNDLIVFADLRGRGELVFWAYNAAKFAKRKRRTELLDARFVMPDSWKHDLSGKFANALERAAKRLRRKQKG
jgi:hypothetical protein